MKRKNVVVLLMICLLFIPSGCGTKMEEKKQVEKMSKEEMDSLKVNEEIKEVKKEIDQEYLESKDLIAVYTFTYIANLKDGSKKTGTLYSAEAEMKEVETEEGTWNYKLESVEIKKLYAYSYTNVLLDPFGGSYANIAYNNYYEVHKEEIDNERIWYKIVLLSKDSENVGSGLVPVLTKEKKESLESQGEKWIML